MKRRPLSSPAWVANKGRSSPSATGASLRETFSSEGSGVAGTSVAVAEGSIGTAVGSRSLLAVSGPPPGSQSRSLQPRWGVFQQPAAESGLQVGRTRQDLQRGGYKHRRWIRRSGAPDKHPTQDDRNHAKVRSASICLRSPEHHITLSQRSYGRQVRVAVTRVGLHASIIHPIRRGSVIQHSIRHPKQKPALACVHRKRGPPAISTKSDYAAFVLIHQRQESKVELVGDDGGHVRPTEPDWSELDRHWQPR